MVGIHGAACSRAMAARLRSKTFNMDRKKFAVPTLSIINGSSFFSGDSCDFTCLPVVFASVTQARLLSKHQ